MWAPFSTRIMRPFIRWRMRRGGLSQSGFLSVWESIPGVIRRDQKALRDLGITDTQIADALELLLARYDVLVRKAIGAWQRAGGHESDARIEQTIHPWPDSYERFEVKAMDTFGIQECPFVRFPWRPCQGTGGSRDVTIESQHGQISFGDLAIHLIRHHHFFEGNVYYRIDPRECVRVLGLEPDVSYAPVWETVPLWRQHIMLDGHVLGHLPESPMATKLEAFARTAPRKVEPIPGVHLYVRGDECVGNYECEGGEFELLVDGHRIRDHFARPGTRAWHKRVEQELVMDEGPAWGAVVMK